METSPLTLGELLYADPGIVWVPEKYWLNLIHAMAAGDEGALRVLLEKAYPVVSSYLMRLTQDRGVTERVILEVFEDVWCEAPIFDSTNGPVLGWIMRQARSSALALASTAELKQFAAGRGAENFLNDPISAQVATDRRSEHARLQVALETLASYEREAIEAALLNGFSYAEVAAQCGESIGTIKKRIRSGLTKLQRALQDRGDEA